MKKSIKIVAPATVANVGCGFDVMGFALPYPNDELVIKLGHHKGVRIHNHTPYPLPNTVMSNCAGRAAHAYLSAIGRKDLGVTIHIHRKIKPGSGIGSSAASAVAAVKGIQLLLGRNDSEQTLLQYCMQGEQAASGAMHADNVAPSLMGGFVLVRSHAPLDVISVPCPTNLFCTLVHPNIEVKTAAARQMIGQSISLRNATAQWGNVGALIAGLYTSNYALIGRAVHDTVAEPLRAQLIPGYRTLKATVMKAGALCCNISGSGPSVFALSTNESTACAIGKVMSHQFQQQNIECRTYVSTIHQQGAAVY